MLNSVLWAGGAARTDGPHRGRAQWEWLEQVLIKARRRNEMVKNLLYSTVNDKDTNTNIFATNDTNKSY